jgi:hypothetical protein
VDNDFCNTYYSPKANSGKVGRCRLTPIKPKLKAPGTKRLKLTFDKLLSNFAFKFNLRRCSKCCDKPTKKVTTGAIYSTPDAQGYMWQGLTLVRFPAQPEPFLVTEATAKVHFPAQPETFL